MEVSGAGSGAGDGEAAEDDGEGGCCRVEKGEWVVVGVRGAEADPWGRGGKGRGW